MARPTVAWLVGVVGVLVALALPFAAAPRAVIEASRRHGRLSAITIDQSQGGVFATLRPFGRLYEVPTRLAGHPDIDWGAPHLTDYPSTWDTYQRTLSPHGDISGFYRIR